VTKLNRISNGGLILAMTDVEPGFEPELESWWDDEHIPQMLAKPGFVGARRFVAPPTDTTLSPELRGPAFLTLYEIDDFSYLHSDRHQRSETPRSRAVRAHRTRYEHYHYFELLP
jgi:hypothetical protein